MRRRTVLSAIGGSVLTLSGCLAPSGIGEYRADGPGVDGTATSTVGDCTAKSAPKPDTGAGLPDAREYPERPPEFTKTAAREFVEDYEQAYKYNAMLSSFQTDGNCVQYLELFILGNETTVDETPDGFDVSVSTAGSYTGKTCPAEPGETTMTPLPHTDLSAMRVQYTATERALHREETIVECW